MAIRAGRKAGAGRYTDLPPAIRSEADLAAHVEALAAAHPQFHPLLTTAGAVPLRLIEPGFRGLFWIVSGQQISVAAARAIFARAEASLGEMSAERLADVDDGVLKTAGLSAPKIRTLRGVATAVLNGELDIDSLADLEAEAAVARLCTVKGIGRWTAEVYLLFALGHPDIFPAGDLALREGARMAFALDARPTEKEVIIRAEEWQPYRSAAARLIWAYYGAVKRGGAPVTPA
ncbi:MAG: DNA-3-methyladenine glycosylase family protein [Rhodomicrobiaceae bacterium]